MNTPQDITNMIEAAEERVRTAIAQLEGTATKLAAASEDLSDAKRGFQAAAVETSDGDLMLDAMTYAVSQSNDPAWQADVRALIAKLTGMDSYTVSNLCDEAGR